MPCSQFYPDRIEPSRILDCWSQRADPLRTVPAIASTSLPTEPIYIWGSAIYYAAFGRLVHPPWVGRLRNYGGRAGSTISSSNLRRGRLMNGEQDQRLAPPHIRLLRLYTEPPCAVGKLHQHGRSLMTTPPVPRMTRFWKLCMPN